MLYSKSGVQVPNLDIKCFYHATILRKKYNEPFTTKVVIYTQSALYSSGKTAER